ncbi:MAG: azurin [Flavobacteriaceae bacterium]|nr:azurin [Flavobacteriaceae bacterium]|tara:strand:+ start:658 stop:1146 length:489 start_codon:yes stop_codon:yes gene_type:complete
MKKLMLTITILLLILSCGEKPKKEKFSYDRVKVEEVEKTDENVLILNSNDQMLFDKSILKASSGEEVTLILNHTGKIGKEFMGHNFVLLNLDVDVDDYAQAAMLAKDQDYIPSIDGAIAYTKMLGGGESDKINFTVNTPGTYTFLCTFPGHYQIMQGQFIVE